MKLYETDIERIKLEAICHTQLYSPFEKAAQLYAKK